MEDELNPLLSRRRELLQQRDTLLRQNLPQHDNEYYEDSTNIIEDSDIETEVVKPSRKPNITVNSSNDSFENSEPFTSTSETPENTIKKPKVAIISNIGVSVYRDKYDNILVKPKKNEHPTRDKDKNTALEKNDISDKTHKVELGITNEINGDKNSKNENEKENQTNNDINLPSNSEDSPSILLKEFEEYLKPLENISEDLESKEPTVNIRMKRKRAPPRHLSSSFKKSCMDFVSDDERILYNEDFSDGSSDNWAGNESETDSSEDQIRKQIKKKMKKKKLSKKKETQVAGELSVKKKVSKNKRKIRKLMRNKGASYENLSGKLIEAKSVQENPCVANKCTRGCFDISEEKRQSVFQYFWSLNSQRKKDWILQCAIQVEIKRKKTKSDNSRRSLTYEYFINEGEGRRQVCQQFLLKTLNITQRYLLYTINAAHAEGLTKEDKRHCNIPAKYDDATKVEAKKFIEKLPSVPSHYCRKSSKRLYLPQDFKSVANLYSIYKKECESKKNSFLSERIFSDIFKKEYNISFHVPKKDKCTLCTKFENNPETSNEDLLSAHNKEKEVTYKRFLFHQELETPNNTTLVASFDLQKVLNTPYGKSMLLYYSRKYAVYCLTFYESITQKGHCYVWGECDGKRGSNDIGTCLYKYVKQVDERGVQHLILYCDSCAGQNKNRIILSILRHALKDSMSLESIQINFLLPGHTYMPVDSMHAVIEREVDKLTVWAPSQWASYMEAARKRPHPYSVNVLDHNDFLNFEDVAENYFTPLTIKSLRLRDMRIATLKKKNLNVVEVKYSMAEESEVFKVELGGKSGGKGKGKGKAKGKYKELKKDKEEKDALDVPVKPLYNKRLPVSLQKYNDLKKLCTNGTIPKRFHKEYLSLPHTAAKADTLPQTDDEDEYDVDF